MSSRPDDLFSAIRFQKPPACHRGFLFCVQKVGYSPNNTMLRLMSEPNLFSM